MQDDSQVSGGYVACASALFQSAPPHDLSSGSLREACFWIHLRPSHPFSLPTHPLTRR